MSTDDPLPEWVIIKVTDRSLIVAAQERDMDKPRCELCGEPMPDGEEMFKFHGYSGPCPKEPLPKAVPKSIADIAAERDALRERCERLMRRIAELERERDAANAGIGRIACERDAARAENRALDEAVAWIRVVGEECDARGDRTVILAKLRADRAENRALREALTVARDELHKRGHFNAAERVRRALAAPEPAQEGEHG